MAIKKGTGFTNLNRILQANQGSGLGQAVAGGVQKQVQTTQSGVQSASQKFQEEAQKNRLDTDEAAQKRQNIIGRFNPQTYKPDESKFQVSSGLQSQYDTKKQQLTGQQSAFQTQQTKNVGDIQARLAADKAKLDAAKKRIADIDAYNKANAPVQSYSAPGSEMTFNVPANYQDRMQAEREIKQYNASLASLQNVLRAQQGFGSSEEARLGGLLSGLDTSYGSSKQAELDAFKKAEVERLMSENAPTEQEIKDFTKYRTGTYSGPTELQDAGTLFGRAAQTEQLADLARSSGGRQELLRRFVGGQDYTSGQRKLDEALLGRDQSVNLGAATREARGVMSETERANEAARQAAQEFRGRAQIFGQETQKQLQEARSPISTEIDTQLAQLQAKEAGISPQAQKIQDILSGKDAAFKDLTSEQRTLLGLEDAAKSGFLTESARDALLSKGGLAERARAAGVDINKLLAERLKTTQGAGLSRAGAASRGQEAIISALDRLAGKAGTDVEFGGQNLEDYKAGTGRFDVDSLRDYITKTEAEKAKTDPKFAQLIAQRPSPTQQMVGGALSGLGVLSGTGAGQAATTAAGGASLAAGLGATGFGAAAAPVAPIAGAVMLGHDLLTGGDSSAQMGEAVTQTGVGAGRVANTAMDKIVNSILNDTKLGDIPVYGQAASELNKIRSKLAEKGLGEIEQQGMTMSQGLRDLTKTGKLDQAFAKLSGADTLSRQVGNVEKTLNTALGGGKTGDWHPSEYNTKDAATGKKVKIASYANKDSKTILDQMRSQMGRSDTYWRGNAEGAQAINELYKYYQNALKREQGNK